MKYLEIKIKYNLKSYFPCSHKVIPRLFSLTRYMIQVSVVQDEIWLETSFAICSWGGWRWKQERESALARFICFSLRRDATPKEAHLFIIGGCIHPLRVMHALFSAWGESDVLLNLHSLEINNPEYKSSPAGHGAGERCIKSCSSRRKRKVLDEFGLLITYITESDTLYCITYSRSWESKVYSQLLRWF